MEENGAEHASLLSVNQLLSQNFSLRYPRAYGPRVRRVTAFVCDGSYIAHVTSRIAMRRPPRVQSPLQRHSRRETMPVLEARAHPPTRLVAFARCVYETPRAVSIQQEAR